MVPTVVGLTLWAPAAPAGAQDPNSLEWRQGPATAVLGRDLAQLEVPAGFAYIGAADTKELMKAMGNPPTGGEIGLAMPTDENADWFVVFEFSPVGYVRDDEKDSIDAPAILESFRRGTELANERRREMGSLPIHVEDWILQPRYEEATHNLVWALEAREEETEDRIGNYNVRLLGRGGYVSATLVADAGEVVSRIPEVEALLAGFEFQEGKRYADFVAGDHVAEIGLTALVAGGLGVAAGKMGLFSKLGRVLLGAWKLVLVGLAGLGAWLRRLFGSGSRDVSTG